MVGFFVLFLGVLLTGASLLRSKLFHPAVAAFGVVGPGINLVRSFVPMGGLSDLLALAALATFIWFILLGALLFRT